MHFEAELLKGLAIDLKANPGFYKIPILPFTRSQDDLFSLATLNILSGQASWNKAKRTVALLSARHTWGSCSVSNVKKAMTDAGYSSRNSNLKAEWIVQNQHWFMDRQHVSFRQPFDDLINLVALKMTNPEERRKRLQREIKGFGLKITSHFLRGLGLDGNQLAVLDTHLIKALGDWPALKLQNLDLDSGMSKKKYFEVENRLRRACNRLNVRLNDVDRFFWRRATFSN